MARMVKLIIPILCLLFALFIASTGRPVEWSKPESWEKPWRVRFAYYEGTSLRYGHMNLSHKTQPECEKHRDAILFAVRVKAFPFPAVYAWCRKDGTQT